MRAGFGIGRLKSFPASAEAESGPLPIAALPDRVGLLTPASELPLEELAPAFEPILEAPAPKEPGGLLLEVGGHVRVVYQLTQHANRLASRLADSLGDPESVDDPVAVATRRDLDDFHLIRGY